MSSLIDKILNNKVINGRVTAEKDSEQWTCLQKIIAINKLIVDYHNAFKELNNTVEEYVEYYKNIEKEWNILKHILQEYSEQWEEFKPLIENIINKWDIEIIPTMSNWSNTMSEYNDTMNEYSQTMQEYESDMMDYAQQINTIVKEWENITLAVRGNYELIGEFTINTSLVVDTKIYNDIIFITDSSDSTRCILNIFEVNNNNVNTDVIAGNINIDGMYSSCSFRYIGSYNNDDLYRIDSNNFSKTFYFAQPTNYKISISTGSSSSGSIHKGSLYGRYIPYFSADQQSEITKINSDINNINTEITNLQNYDYNLNDNNALLYNYSTVEIDGTDYTIPCDYNKYILEFKTDGLTPRILKINFGLFYINSKNSINCGRIEISRFLKDSIYFYMFNYKLWNTSNTYEGANIASSESSGKIQLKFNKDSSESTNYNIYIKEYKTND